MDEDYVESLQDLLAYLDLHLSRYQWKQLTTDQKNMLADMIDASRLRAAVREGYTDVNWVERWWNE